MPICKVIWVWLMLEKVATKMYYLFIIFINERSRKWCPKKCPHFPHFFGEVIRSASCCRGKGIVFVVDLSAFSLSQLATVFIFPACELSSVVVETSPRILLAPARAGSYSQSNSSQVLTSWRIVVLCHVLCSSSVTGFMLINVLCNGDGNRGDGGKEIKKLETIICRANLALQGNSFPFLENANCTWSQRWPPATALCAPLLAASINNNTWSNSPLIVSPYLLHMIEAVIMILPQLNHNQATSRWMKSA